MALGVAQRVSCQSIGVSWESLGVSWGSLGWPLRLLEGLLAVLGVSRVVFGMSWGAFLGRPSGEAVPT